MGAEGYPVATKLAFGDSCSEKARREETKPTMPSARAQQNLASVFTASGWTGYSPLLRGQTRTHLSLTAAPSPLPEKVLGVGALRMNQVDTCSVSFTTAYKGKGVGLSRGCTTPSPEPRRERCGPLAGVREKAE